MIAHKKKMQAVLSMLCCQYLVFTEHGEDYKIKVNTELRPEYFLLTLLGRSLVELKVKGPVHLIVHFTHCPVLRSELPVNRGLH